MGDIYKARWDFITKMFQKIKPYVDDPVYKVVIEDCNINNLEITDHEILSDISDKGDRTCFGSWALNDKEWDQGLYTSIPEWKKWFDENVQIYTVVPVKWK